MSWTHCGFSQGFFFKSGVAFARKNWVRTSAAICLTRWWFAWASAYSSTFYCALPSCISSATTPMNSEMNNVNSKTQTAAVTRPRCVLG